MLLCLRIRDIVLIEEAEVTFHQGFHVLTGETGAGKSAILRALSLVLGERADSQSLRSGAKNGSVEAAFDVEYGPALRYALEEAGIQFDENEVLLLRRDVLSSGKSRAYINNQMAQVATLKHIARHLVELVGQHANQEVRDVGYHRTLCDRFGGHSEALSTFRDAFNRERELSRQLEELNSNEAERLRESEMLRAHLEEIQLVQPQEDEEEELFQEYSRLSNADALHSSARHLVDLLSDNDNSICAQVVQAQKELEQLCALDMSTQPMLEELQSSAAELQELTHSLRDYLGHIDSNPLRAQELSDRLQTLTQLKKKFGPSLLDVLNYQTSATQRLETLDNAEGAGDGLQCDLDAARIQTDSAAKHLTQTRAQAAKQLGAALTKELRQLNMPAVDVDVRVTKQERTNEGDDYIELHFAPNAGEKMVSVCSCASGGELSRITLAIRILLADKQVTPTLVFDEVDANIGGTTATLVGEKLQKLGEYRQVLCITHFPQAAQSAHHHLLVQKNERDQRTHTTITTLNSKERATELQRMAGGVKSPVAS